MAVVALTMAALLVKATAGFATVASSAQRVTLVQVRPRFGVVCADAQVRSVAARIRGGGDAPLDAMRSRARELGGVLATHAWCAQPWSRRLAFLLAFACMAVAKVVGMRASFALARAIDCAATLAKGAPGPLLLTPAARALGAHIGLRVGAVLCEELRRCLFAPVAQHAVRSLSEAVFREAHEKESAWHDAQPAGGLDRVFHRGARALQTLLAAVCFNVAPTIFEACAVLVVLWRQCGATVCGCAAITFGATVAIGVVANEQRRAVYAEANRCDNALSSFFVHSLRTHELVKLASAESAECAGYAERVRRLLRLRVALGRSLALLNAAQRGAFGGGTLAILLLALRDVRSGRLAASKLVVLNGLLRQLSSPLQQLGSSYTAARQACVDLGAIIELARPEVGTEGKPRPRLPQLPADLGDGALSLERVTVDVHVAPRGRTDAIARVAGDGAVESEADMEACARAAAEEEEEEEEEEGKGEGDCADGGLRARRAERRGDGSVRLLSEVSLTVRRGERVAIIGPSGAGKSTLLRILAQLQPPSAGRVLLGGHDLARFDARSVRRRLAMVPHEGGLGALLERDADEHTADEPGASITLREWLRAAVRYAAPDASTTEVDGALAAVGLGTHAPEGDEGAARDARAGGASQRAAERERRLAGARKLSAGELLRLSLARALARRAAVLACDEPTANLDALSAARAGEALRRAAAESAVLVVTHDLRTVVDFDRIVVLDRGKCVAAGTHAELLGRCALYRELWATQSKRGD